LKRGLNYVFGRKIWIHLIPWGCSRGAFEWRIRTTKAHFKDVKEKRKGTWRWKLILILLLILFWTDVCSTVKVFPLGPSRFWGAYQGQQVKGRDRNIQKGLKGEAFSSVKNRSYFLNKGLSFGPFQNLEATIDSLAGIFDFVEGTNDNLAFLEGAFEIFYPKSDPKIH
jgi:hypothetical protein